MRQGRQREESMQIRNYFLPFNWFGASWVVLGHRGVPAPLCHLETSDPAQQHQIQSGSRLFQVIKAMQHSAYPPALCVQITDALDQINSSKISRIFNICAHESNRFKIASEAPGLQELCCSTKAGMPFSSSLISLIPPLHSAVGSVFEDSSLPT